MLGFYSAMLAVDKIADMYFLGKYFYNFTHYPCHFPLFCLIV